MAASRLARAGGAAVKYRSGSPPPRLSKLQRPLPVASSFLPGAGFCSSRVTRTRLPPAWAAAIAAASPDAPPPRTKISFMARPPVGSRRFNTKWNRPASPFGLGLHHAAGDVQPVQVLALDDQLAVIGVEGLQDHAVPPLDIPLEGAFALVAVDDDPQVPAFQSVLAVDQGQVAVLDAGLHAVPADHQIKVVGRVFDAGVLLAVIFLKGEGAIPRLDGA